VNVGSAEVGGFARHPLGGAADIPLRFDRTFRSDRSLPPGRWTVHLTVRRGRDQAHVIDVLS
jgi:hypothetical protein